jgi:uncharacterized membrane protein YccF (DUF307 family)
MPACRKLVAASHSSYSAANMSALGNIVFFIFGGFVIFFGYVLGGILLCLTIVGIPFGFQCFKLAGGVLAPFGREVRAIRQPDSTLSVLLNILWIILPGLELALMHLVLAVFFALTIVGIPIASQHLKLMPLALLPFGRQIVDIDSGRTYP